MKAKKAKKVKLPYHCSFCGKGYDEVRVIIGGGPSLRICNECVLVCNTILLCNVTLPPARGEWRRQPPKLRLGQLVWEYRRAHGTGGLLATCTREDIDYKNAPEWDVVWWSVPFDQPVRPPFPKKWPRR